MLLPNNPVKDRGLFASHGANHLGEALDLFDQECVSLPLDETDARQTGKFTRDSLAMGADAARNLGMGRRRRDACRLASLANLSNSAWMRLLTASVLNS